MSYEAPKTPFAVCRMDPRKLEPEDFTDAEIDHGDGGWGLKFDDDADTDTEDADSQDEGASDDQGDDNPDWLTGVLDE